MLYGFPDGRSNLNHYLPINGGEVGGRLEILGEDGEEYILSRTVLGADLPLPTLMAHLRVA